MSIILTYFVHGTTTDNENGLSSGWNNPELSEVGKSQCLKLKDSIANKSFDIVFCSDLKRAADSAALIFENTAPIIPDKRLRECNYGDYNGKESKIVEPIQEMNIIQPFPNGESYEDVKKRISEFLNFLKVRYTDQNVIIAMVAHKAPQLALDVLLKGKTWEQAFHEDWRKTKAWKPGWDYIIS